ncbi:transposase [Streptomyces chilikensis]|uniref:transposase n=1 Tax=Streptomyces chilikensis TaxID=1194079 RepID=UPI0030B8B5AE
MVERLVPEAPSPRQGGDRRRHGDREVPAAIAFVAASGRTWQQLPAAPSGATAHRRHERKAERFLALTSIARTLIRCRGLAARGRRNGVPRPATPASPPTGYDAVAATAIRLPDPPPPVRPPWPPPWTRVPPGSRSWTSPATTTDPRPPARTPQRPLPRPRPTFGRAPPYSWP